MHAATTDQKHQTMNYTSYASVHRYKQLAQIDPMLQQFFQFLVYFFITFPSHQSE